MPTDPFDTAAVLRAIGRVSLAAIGVSNAADAEQRVFVAGLEEADTEAEGLVPLADDFTEVGLPVVTVALAPWTPALYGSSERRTLALKCAVWRDRVDIGQSVRLLLGDLDALVDAFLDHGLAFGEVDTIQSVQIKGGPGIRPRAVPKKVGDLPRLFLTLPYDVDVKCHRRAQPRPQ
jgi:hypothetical protein